MNRRQFLLGAMTSAWAVGCRDSAPRPTAEADLSSLDRGEPFDVCIIGSGPAGAIVATGLARRGFRALLLESGGSPEAGGDDRLQPFRNSGTIGYPVTASRFRGLGGTSNLWTGRCTRLQPIDFEPNAYTPEGSAWPLRYADLEPYYQQAEATLRVRGGRASKYAAPRRSDFPLREEMDISALRSLVDRAGVTLDLSSSSTSPSGDGPLRVATDMLPALRSLPKATMLSGGPVTNLVARADGTIEAAEVRTLDGARAFARARCFVVAAGGLETPRLLLLSRSAAFPDGIGNARDRVGRGFTDHPNYHYYARIEHNWGTLSPHYEIGRSHQFYQLLKNEGLGSAMFVFIQSWIFPDDVKDVKRGDWRGPAGAVLRRVGKAELMIGTELELRSVDSNRVTLASDQRDPFGNPVGDLSFSFTDDDRRTRERAFQVAERVLTDLGASEIQPSHMDWGHHHMGTCRMGDDPRTSVVDSRLRVHDSPNLYVAGSAAFVTAGAAQPTLTIAALSHRLADHLSEILR